MLMNAKLYDAGKTPGGVIIISKVANEQKAPTITSDLIILKYFVHSLSFLLNCQVSVFVVPKNFIAFLNILTNLT